ncbi:hypothetical protein R7Z48_11945 [Vibrio sp. 1567]|uniref:hypothetical protein n=1 Tax=Vibrio sp. 1567 TaxID=3074564 RepID=UPI0029645EC2|nr:hypothetical protein [Vibrio sp. 1567]MDW2170140.1 hypothetical protein [Vibrio sp. 1567]
MNRSKLTSLALILIGSSVTVMAEEQSNQSTDNSEVEILKKVSKRLEAGGNEWKWQDFQVDTSPGSITAMSLLGISGDSTFNIENVKDIKIAFEGVTTTDSGMGYGIAFTPARSSLFPMDLHTYASGWFYRLVGNTSIGYAEGEADIENSKFDRRAISVKTSMFLNSNDDPIIAIARAIEVNSEHSKGVCNLSLGGKVGTTSGSLPDTTDINSNSKDDSKNKETAELIRVREEFKKCRESVLKAMRWNRSQLTLAYATGWVEESNGDTSQESLGHSAGVNVLYGFDHFNSSTLKDNFAISLTYQSLFDEPVLETLGTTRVEFKDNDLFTGEIIGGTDKFRVLLQGSTTSSNDVTASQRTFKYAGGFDYKVYADTWLHLRVGKQRTFDGDDDEVSSLLKISYSPGALIEKSL